MIIHKWQQQVGKCEKCLHGVGPVHSKNADVLPFFCLKMEDCLQPGSRIESAATYVCELSRVVRHCRYKMQDGRFKNLLFFQPLRVFWSIGPARPL